MDERGDVIWDNLIYLLILILFLIPMFIFVNSNSRGSAALEDFYVKEIAAIIDNAKPGMEFKIDITKLTAVAVKNGKPLNEIISIDNVNNEIRVSSRLNGATSFKFFNDVDVTDWYIESPSLDPETSRFIFKIKENQK